MDTHTFNSICAIVVTYNRKRLLGQCLDAVLKQSRAVDGIIVIDNGSNDGTGSFLRDNGYIQHPKINYVRLEFNCGSSGGFHEGIRLGTMKGYKWLWLMDDDAEPQDSALANLVSTEITSSRELAGLGCRVIDIEGNSRWEHSGEYNIIRQKISPVRFDRNPQPVVKVSYISWVGLLVRADITTTAGLPCKSLFYGMEDIEYTTRLCRYGDLFLVANAVIVHKSDGGYHGRRIYYLLRNPLLILHLRGVGAMRFTLGVIIAAFRLLKFLRTSLTRREESIWQVFNFAYKGFLHGVLGRAGQDGLETIGPNQWESSPALLHRP